MERFEIRNEAGQVLNTIDEWKLGFNDDIHWKEGYSGVFERCCTVGCIGLDFVNGVGQIELRHGRDSCGE
jgi:hypothetical protein